MSVTNPRLRAGEGCVCSPGWEERQQTGNEEGLLTGCGKRSALEPPLRSPGSLREPRWRVTLRSGACFPPHLEQPKPGVTSCELENIHRVASPATPRPVQPWLVWAPSDACCGAVFSWHRSGD